MLATKPTPIPLNDLRRAYQARRGLIDEAVARVLASGWYSLGTEVEAFEGEFADYVGVTHAIGVASGTDALELCLVALGCCQGDEVITAANAGGFTSVAARKIGAEPRYADVCEETLMLTAETIAAGIGDRTRAVVVTHLYGRLAEIEPIASLCRSRGLVLIEDCAQAVGATQGGRRAGSFGDAAAFSFYPTKNLGAAGDGGMVVCRSPVVAEAVRSLRQYGWSARYHVDRPGGRNSRLDELQAAILRARLPFVDGDNERRRQILALYGEALDARWGRLMGSMGPDDAAHLAVILTADRERAIADLERSGVSTSIHFPIPDHRQPHLAGGAPAAPLPITEYACAHVLTIPLFPELHEDEVARICETLSRAPG
jgi:dTDP-4-amino-4,6-dideoxygalactose transaminase